MKLSHHMLAICAGPILSAAAQAPPSSFSRAITPTSTERIECPNDPQGTLGRINDAMEAGNRTLAFELLESLTPCQEPASMQEAASMVQDIVASAPNNWIVQIGCKLVNGIFLGMIDDLFNRARQQDSSPENSHDNKNPDPPEPLYPKKCDSDPPYSNLEQHLRSAIFIPETFTYGKKPPVILFPGTGSTGFITYNGNFIPLLTGVDWADPVWVNVPRYLLDDAQSNAEYAAYAINYIASLTGCNVTMIPWSQGNIDTQWALKYWPSARSVTSSHVAISADFKGTTLAKMGLRLFPGIFNDPAIFQQQYFSNFITTMRSNGGDSAYVPTTSLYSGFHDQVVEPQSGTNASAYMLDARDVGVTNAEVQEICKDQPAGSFYTHESMLANPLTFALAENAICNGREGRTDQIPLQDVCSTYLTPGLDFDDFLKTENSIIIAVLAMLIYTPKVEAEPPIMAYATAD
ncbi:hypothetical protein CDD82_653 [Ophiocordyceps australis]|uniref:Uncharacterized protein n=1 Tax=Ophiocordyceps australis TaxID=1399860 RepID=A0A2C5YHT1_9HYPO|nr:hypothetical protein CDD82_653 [Ophiocordyceps australis]